MSVFDNVSFGLELKRVPRGERRDRVKEMLQVVQLEGMEKRKPQQLSGGQQQRVALARALVNRPARSFLDEPLGAPRRQAPQADAAGAEADPDRARHDVRLRHARPGRGADDVDPDRGHERRRHRADRRPEGDLRASADAVRRRLRRLPNASTSASTRSRTWPSCARERTTRRPGRARGRRRRRAARRGPAGARRIEPTNGRAPEGGPRSREPWPSSSISAA